MQVQINSFTSKLGTGQNLTSNDIDCKIIFATRRAGFRFLETDDFLAFLHTPYLLDKKHLVTSSSNIMNALSDRIRFPESTLSFK